MNAAAASGTSFPPIAIVGRSCLLPGAATPEALWEAVADGRDLVSAVPSDRWGLAPDDVLCSGPEDSADRTWSDRGGYVRGFNDLFDPEGFALPASEILALDPVFQWTFHTARQALQDAGHDMSDPERFGAVFGNLSFPSAAMAAYTQAKTIEALPGFGQAALDAAGIDTPDARNRFMSGLPALLLERALGLGVGAFALDAACASSLYAIKLACDRLHDGDADLMLAGAVNCADDLCVHLGFSALTALSRTGRSRPFHREADGLVPAEGCAFVALRRLDDAVRDGDTIHGIIRGVGLSNDGRGRGMLVPSSDGQSRAISRALDMSGLDPHDISLLECHATGTQVGDATEIASSAAAYAGCNDLPIGSLKSNMGHLITAAGVGGLIKVLEAMRHQVRPPTLHVDTPLDVIADSPFRLLDRAEPWNRASTSDGVLRAGVSAFGFGGNNAHLIVEEPQAAAATTSDGALGWPSQLPQPSQPLAIVGIGISAAAAVGRPAFTEALLGNTSCLDATGHGVMPDISLPIANQKFPPNDLKKALAQQLAIMQVADEAIADAGPLPNLTTGVYVGMGTDPEAARFGVRWRIATSAKRWGCSPEWVATARDAIGPVLDAPGVLGTMPNIVANRLNSQYDLAGPSFTVSSEERSGLDAVDLAARALRAGEIDAALVGAVDLSCDPVHRVASASRLPDDRQTPGDAAVMLVLKRLEDAERDGDKVYAILPGGRFDQAARRLDDRPDVFFGSGEQATSVTDLFGHAHAASGLVHLAVAAITLHHRTTRGDSPLLASNSANGSGLADGVGPRTAAVHVDAMDGIATRPVLVAEATRHLAPSRTTCPRLHLFSGTTPAEVLERVSARQESNEGPCRLVIVADHADQFGERAERARRHVQEGHPPGVGVHFRATPVAGDMAFVFTAAGAAYHGMGEELLRALPELASPISETFPLGDVASWVFGANDYAPTPSDFLWGTSLLTQSHAQLTRHLLALEPTAAIGYSSGESGSLYAFGIWSDMDAMRHEIESCAMMDSELGVDFAAVARAWGTESADWTMWNVLAPLDQVRQAIADEDRVHLAIINTSRDVVIGGDSAACSRVVDHLGARRCWPLAYNLACHVPEVGAGFHQQWLDVHTRTVTPTPGIRVYSNGINGAYELSTAACASAITRQAESTVDFPATINAAYDDGVRIFVEHGPAGACTNFINEILADRDILAVQLDRRGLGVEQVFEAIGALIAAGVDVDHQALTDRLAFAPAADAPEDRPNLTFPAHPAPAQLPPRPTAQDTPAAAPPPPSQAQVTQAPPSRAQVTQAQVTQPRVTQAQVTQPQEAPRQALSRAASSRQTGSHQIMTPAPALPPVAFLVEHAAPVAPDPAIATTGAAADTNVALGSSQPGPLDEFAASLRQQVAATTAMHTEFLRQQSAVHEQFLGMRSLMLRGLGNTGQQAGPAADVPITAVAATPTPAPALLAPPAPLAPPTQSPASPELVTVSPGPVSEPQKPASPPAETPVSTSAALVPADPVAEDSNAKIRFAPTGPKWNREQLEIHSSGKISELFGPAFAAQDARTIQCRMPEPPLLLADRVTGLVAEPGVLGRGTVWTETDVAAEAFYLNDGYMPAGFMIESGQADLLLISYMGIDLVNDPGRAYRLLGCTLTYHGDLPAPGDTLEYEIRITGHAKHGDVRLFFFEYDCIVDGERRLTVRDAQAGFFSPNELRDALGVLWTPEVGRADLQPDARVDPPLVACTKASFTNAEVVAFSQGRALECFGPGFEWTETHTRTPKIQAGDQLFIDEITVFDPTGGPWGRGFMRCETEIRSDDWFFDGHFKNDPCMPGNFMVEACIEAMSFYLAALGHTTRRDGWRFQPLPEQPFELKCRGEINPQSKRVGYELHIEEVWSDPHPTLICDVIGFVDGHAAFHAHRIGIELTPDWPLTSMPELYQPELHQSEPYQAANESVAVATDSHGFPFDWKAMISCAWGRPSEAFGSMYEVFDGTRRSPRLPGLPYHFISRIIDIDGELDKCTAGMKIVCEYDIPEDAWYFAENGTETMPFAVLLEAALQPCGWVASAIGSATAVETDLLFRNLDGTGTVISEIGRSAGTLTTRVELTSVSRAGGMIIEGFQVECSLGEQLVYTMDTVFGFFPPEAFEDQAGLAVGDDHRALVELAAGTIVDLTAAPDRFCSGSLRLAAPMLLMLDRATHLADAGAAGLGVMRGEKDVDVSEWFFKAHFFQDPVQPGSLGVEALLQLLQFYMLDTDMASGIATPRFEPIMVGTPMTWKYRGQVTPKNQLITSVMEITEVGHDEQGPFVIGTGSLWCDGLRIYAVEDMGMRIVDDDAGAAPEVAVAADSVSEDRASEERASEVALFDDTALDDTAVDDTACGEISLEAAKDTMRAYWQPVRQTPSDWLGDDLLDGLVDRYVHRIRFAGADTLEGLQGRPAIYLANHQVQIESLIISNLLPALTGVAMTTVANAKHERRWIGEVIDALDGYPGCRAVEQLAYFDPAQPASMFDLISEVRARMMQGAHSFFVHTDGTRAQSCREVTTKCSSVFLDLAIELDLPIVPVRFIGGLPIDPIEGKAEFPVGHGSQDYWIGEPIEAAELGSMTLRDRVDRVITSINTLGASHDDELPLPSDPAFAARAESWQERTGCHEVFASAWQILAETSDASPDTELLRVAASGGEYRSDGTARGNWLGEVATLLFGPNVPTIAGSASETVSESTVVVNKSTHPHLADHVVNGVPVVPMVYALEWFARSAGAHKPGLALVQLTNVRVLKGLVAEAYDGGGDLVLTISAETTAATVDGVVVQLRLVDAASGRPHYSCKALMRSAASMDSDAPTTDAVHELAITDSPPHCPADGLYGVGVLFHGPRFRVIHGLSEMSSSGFTASLGGVSDRSWPVELWITDPAMLDGGLQMALLWTDHLLGGPSLPTALGKLRVLRTTSPGRFTATLTGTESTKTKVVCNVVFRDERGHVVAELIGIETHLLPPTAR